MMNLSLPEETLALQGMFARLFETESSSERIRAAEPAGFDPALWRLLCEVGAPALRVPVDRGGSALSLLDAAVMMEEAGRRLATVPLAEAVAVAQLLAESDHPQASACLAALVAGEQIVTLALLPVIAGQPQLVPGCAAAHIVVALRGDRLLMFHQQPAGAAPAMTPAMVASLAAAWFAPPDGGIEIARGPAAVARFNAAVEEWKILTAAALIGMGDQALAMAAAYACERVQFGQLIGTFQGLSHPLANCVIDIDGGRMLLYWLLSEMDGGDGARAAAGVDQLWWWANHAATRSVAQALHSFGGYGLTNEYDIQLYHRRAKGLGLMLGDPELALERAGRRLYLNEAASLPDPGRVTLDFRLSEPAARIAQETRDLFHQILTPELRAKAHHSFEGHDWSVSRAIGQAGLMFPAWPEQWGGRGVSHDLARASLDVWDEFGWTVNPQGTTNMVGRIIQAFGTDDLQQEVLLRMGRGEITAALGYTEPSGGSDVFGARTRAVRDGDGWVINGQKMFTSGAEWASYVLLIARTDPDAPKHKGLTLFLVPLDAPGVEIHPVFTFMDERSNATFYTDVRVADHYRLGAVNGGVKVLAAALQMEQGAVPYYHNLRRMAGRVAEWARDHERNGRPAIEDGRVLARLAMAHARAQIGHTLADRISWVAAQKLPDLAYGPAAKVFITESFITHSADLMDLAAPDSLLRGRDGLGVVEEGYRHSAATTIYAGTSEVLRSLVGERRLGLPRSRA